MSAKLKAFSILAKKIREVYLGWSASRQMLAIPCNFLARSIHRHFFPLLRLMSHSDHLPHAKNMFCLFWTPAKVLIKKKMPNYKEWDVTQFNSATTLTYAFGVKIKYSKISFFEQTSHIYCKYRKMYAIYCCSLSNFPSTSPGTATRPSPASVHGLMGQRGRKSKNESGLPHPIPLPPASAYITV